VECLGVKNVCIPAGTKIAQIRIVEIPNTELVSGVIKKEENDDKKRGDNGFNSSGVK
jgi:dUTPase